MWTTELPFRLGDWTLSADLRDWVNDGLMTFFFLVVGLEAKRELDLGELRDRKRLALPVVAALGGMLVPVAIYVAFNADADGGRGWGAAMSTDTAFALGLLALAAPRGATRLRVFLLTLAVVDDLGALLVIATAYSENVSLDRAGRRHRALRRARSLLRFAPVGAHARGRRRRGRDLGRHVQVGHPPDDRRAGHRAGDERLPAVARRPRAPPARASARFASSPRPSSRAPPSSA